MSLLVTLNGANYIIPQTNEVGWGSNLDDYFVAIAAGVLQKTGGTFTLSAETDFGSSYGLKSLYYKSRASNVAATGAIRLANAETGIVWRNFLNNADLALTVNASNQLSFNGVPIQPNTLTSAHILVGNGSNIATDVAMTGDISIDNTGLTAIGAGKIVNSQINASAAIARSKLAALTASRAMATDASGFDTVSATTAVELGYVSGVTSAIQTQLDAKQTTTLTSGNILVGNVSNVAASVAMSGDITITNAGVTAIGAGKIVNAQVNAAAAIAYSKLNLTGSIVNADINASAAIAYSKLNLALSIVNADVSTSAAIAYSKLNLTGSIVNADVNASAAIAYSKLALTGSIVNADISSSAAIAITKVAIGTANQIIGTNAGATANEFKTLTATANQVSVTHGVGTVTFATPQDIGTASAVRFGSLTIGGALDASAALSIISTTKGFLPPSMTTTQKNAISSPTDGLIVYDASLAQLFLRAGGSWTPLSVGGGSGTVASGTQYQIGYYATSTNTISSLSTLITDASGNLGVNIGAGSINPDSTGATAVTIGSGLSGVSVPILTLRGSRTTSSSQFAGLQGWHQTTKVGQVDFLRGTADDEGYIVFQTKKTGVAIADALTLDQNQKATFASTILAANGASGSPSIAFASDTGTGIYRGGASDLIIQTGGSDRVEISTTKLISSVIFLAPAGAVGAPSYSFGSDQDTGLYNTADNAIRFANGGTATVKFTDATLQMIASGYTIENSIGTNLLPAYSFSGDNNTGMYSAGADTINWATGGSARMSLDNTSLTLNRAFYIGDGSVGSPSITFGADTGLGLYRIGTNNMGITVNGAKKVDIGASTFQLQENLGFNSTSTQGIIGTVAVDNAAAGNVGETVLGNQTTFTAFPTTNQWGDLTSISLTAGDWLVWSTVHHLNNGGTSTAFQSAITTTTGNSTTGFTNGLNNFQHLNPTGSTAITQDSISITAIRFSISATTTVYLKYSATFSGTAPTAAGNIRALRIR